MRLALVLLLAACVRVTPTGSKCPDKPPCLATLQCHYESETGCEICHCSDAYIDRGAEPSPGQPPFPNH